MTRLLLNGVILLIFANRKSDVDPYIVVIRCADRKSEKAALEFLDENTKRMVVKSKSVQKGAIEVNAEIRLRNDDTDFINALSDCAIS